MKYKTALAKYVNTDKRSFAYMHGTMCFDTICF